MVDLITAIFLALASFSISMRQIVLSPSNASFPPAPPYIRAAMFGFGLVLAYCAVIFGGAVSIQGHHAGAAASIVLLLAIGLGSYNALMLLNLLRQRYPVSVWRRLNRAAEVVRESCPEKRAAFPAPVHVRTK